MSARETHLDDQVDAAGEEQAAILDALGTLLGHHQHDGPSPTTDRLIARLLREPLAAGTLTLCPHLGAAPQPVYVHAARPGHLHCRRCLVDLIDDQAVDIYTASPRCDACTRPSATFSEVTLTVGPILIMANVCGRCVPPRPDRGSDGR
ncbi:MAG: hypothetical protein U5R31_13725 [Acidimicrobiia bacterium]|nr:hypothetical protein [Acidimicrobiia bacterium]